MKEGWEKKKLGEIGRIYNGNSINEKIKKEKYLGIQDGFPYIGTKDVGYDYHIDYDNGVRIPFDEASMFKVAPDDTVFVCAEGGSAGRKIAYTNQDVCFGNKLFALTTLENVCSKFVFYYYQSNIFKRQFNKSLTGIIGGVSMNKFKELFIPLPSHSEQKRIVSILEKAFDAIEKAKTNAEENLKNSKELFESYLNNIFVNKGDDWEDKKLGEILTIRRGGSPRPISKYLTSSPDGLNWIKISDATASNKYILETKEKINKEGLSKSREVKEGDLILSNSMSFGRPYIMKTSGCIHDGWLVLKQEGEKILDAEFLYYLLSSRFVFEQFNYLAAGSTVRNLNINLVSSVKVSFPLLSQQKSVVKKLNSLNSKTQKLEVIYQKKIEALEEMKKSLLQKAFNGEL
jgi:type I restriction enzyme, S subunit